MAGHELLMFTDALFGLQKIQMEPSDQEDVAFIMPIGIYICIVLPFVLENVEAIYQRLVNRMFK